MSELLRQFGPKKEGYKQYTDAFNPFNSWKVAYHTDRMKLIMNWLKYDSKYPHFHTPLPPPVYVTLDPSDACGHSCPWCLSATIQDMDSTTLKEDLMIKITQSILSWENARFMVKAMVLAGGGEPLLNKGTLGLLKYLSKHKRVLNKDFEFSIISNGEFLTEEISEILCDHATWAGFSIDSGNSEDHKKMHVPKRKNVDGFKIVIDNVAKLCEIKSVKKSKLNIGYKFNIHPDSVTSMIEGAQLAKRIGCNQIQFKPTHVDNAIDIMPPIIEEAQNNIMECRKTLEDDNFKVYGAIHKFGPQWSPNHDFGACTMTPLGMIISANSEIYLCCDRRGDPTLSLGKWNEDGKITNFSRMWGSLKHKELINGIKTSECPRCTFYHYQKVAVELTQDNMNYNFL